MLFRVNGDCAGVDRGSSTLLQPKNHGRFFFTLEILFQTFFHKHFSQSWNKSMGLVKLDERRVNVTAVSRANMSTALVERRGAKRTRGAAPH